jgi:polysaccharide pyruvyl transferase WcaK-like protein
MLSSEKLVKILSVLKLFKRLRHMKTYKILLLSSWQTVNIGDIAHTPGLLKLLYAHFPQVEIYLYGNVQNGVEEILTQRFPKLKFVKSEAEYLLQCDNCDFLLHGSGPYLVGYKNLESWIQRSPKPYGVMGITLGSDSYPEAILKQVLEQLKGAKFVYFRDSLSLKFAIDQGLQCPCMEFGPDAAFATDLSNSEKADHFLESENLKDGQYLCCIPKFRYTPYWLIHPELNVDAFRMQRNTEMAEHDHAPLRDAITAVVQNTTMKILLCPEDQSQMAIGKEYVYDKLPDEIKRKVVWKKDYWLTDEARSVYLRSAGLFGMEMHSPIMCIGSGIPAIVGRFKEQTTKGYMWRDIGLNDWLFDMDKPEEVDNYASTVLSLATQPESSRLKAQQARKKVEDRFSVMLNKLEATLMSL